MTYTDETKRILEAVISGDCCPDCNAPNGDRHFDECPPHPENVSEKSKGADTDGDFEECWVAVDHSHIWRGGVKYTPEMVDVAERSLPTGTAHPENVPLIERAKYAIEWGNSDPLHRELVDELERLHSWDGLMSLLDEHYPSDIFPTEPDRDTRDPGPRIISLLRRLHEARRPLVPIVDDLASERIDGLRDERDELLCRVDELADENDELRRQLPDYEVTR